MERGTKIFIVILGALFLIFLAYLIFNIFGRTCTLIGCTSNLTLTLPEQIPSNNLVVILDDYEIIDNCNGRYQNINNTREKNRIYLPVQHPLSDELIEQISLLKIGYRETCESETTILYSYSDLSVEYRTVQPNGPRCGPPCYQAIINLE